MLPDIADDKIKIHFFDMDHTLADNDCDVSWKQFLVAENLAGTEALERADYYYRQYASGTLDQAEFMRFQLKEFVGRTETEMRKLAEKHFLDFVKPRIYPDALTTVRMLKNRALPVILLTSTNCVMARPLAAYFEMDDCLAANLEIKDGCYTGNITGEYPLGPGKVVHAREYCRSHGFSLADAAYWGDSINDFNILDAVGRSFAVNPVPELREIAQDRHWHIIAFD